MLNISVIKHSLKSLKLFMYPNFPVQRDNLNMQIVSSAKLNKNAPKIGFKDTMLAMHPTPINTPAKKLFLTQLFIYFIFKF